ncbi:hypothetical protein L484_007439 [Morus notabilis]|uniref:Uncharacterized protein n=1 Tax=Morus notabilis TaxID=981085 RepID=W9R7J7_9ROSA|nr:hypothetical protein L484_007439 [Morus notabilis]
MKYEVEKTPEEVLKLVKESVAYAKSLGCDDIEFFVMGVKSRGNDLLGGLYTGINTKQIVPTSKMRNCAKSNIRTPKPDPPFKVPY